MEDNKALGTQTGKVFILDLEGNLIRLLPEYHQSVVKDLSIDECGEYIASCSYQSGTNFTKNTKKGGNI